MDPRITKLAQILIHHSCDLKAGEKILIESIGCSKKIILALIREAKLAGAVPFVNMKDDQIIRELCLVYYEEDIKLMADFELFKLKQMDAFIGIRETLNSNELSDLPGDKLKKILDYYIKPVHLEERNKNTKWVYTRWPTSSMAQSAGMSTAAFENYYFNACTIDYDKLQDAMKPLAGLMKKTEKVRILGPGDTDFSFLISGMPQCLYSGEHNLPDGELLTAPIKDSVNGRIQYNVPSIFYGNTFENICFDFKNGKIIKATCNNTQKLDEILNQDEGARYIGEFAFGLNPKIRKPVKDVLFDEKIAGSIHLTPGNAYKICDNGNRSSIHWDIILIQTPEMGGGDIYFDNILIRKDGRFVTDELEGLNPENLR